MDTVPQLGLKKELEASFLRADTSGLAGFLDEPKALLPYPTYQQQKILEK